MYGRAQKFETYRTALMDAATRGHVDIVKILKRAECRMVDADGRSALMLAAS